MSGKIIFFIGRLVFALSLIAMGYVIFTQGHNVYDKYLHAFRKQFLPDTSATAKVVGSITWEELNKYLIRVVGALFSLSGLLFLVNKRGQGAWLLFIALTFVLLTKDNPFLQSNLKSIKSEQGQRNKDFVKHLSVLGVGLMMLVV